MVKLRHRSRSEPMDAPKNKANVASAFGHVLAISVPVVALYFPAARVHVPSFAVAPSICAC